MLSRRLMRTVQHNLLTTPSAPTNVSASNGANNTAVFSWSLPNDDGGAAITAYIVSRDGVDLNGGGPWSTTVDGAVRTFTFNDLISGNTYTFTVAAINATGTGPATTFQLTVPTSVATAPTANLTGRFVADDLTGVDQSPVASWAPRVGTGAASQATAANQPNLRVGFLNGHNTVEFNGTSDTLALTGGLLELARNKSNLVVSVIYRTAGFNTAGPRSLFGLSHGTSTGGSRALLSQREQVAGYMQATGRRLDTDTVQGLAASTTAVNGLNELVNLTAVYRWSTSDLLLFKNGTQIASSTTFQTDGTTSDTPSLAGVIGSNLAGAAEFFAGHIAEILVYNTADTAGTLVTQINDYAQATYGTGTVTPPVAAFTATPTVGTSPLAVQFTSTSTGAPTSYLWEFGDGTTSTVANPSKTYTSADTYTVSLTVTNSAGSDTENKQEFITVSVPVATAPTANLTGRFVADDLTGVDQSPVASWAPRVGTGAASQATAANQPNLRVGFLNGHNTVEFNGTSDTLALTGGLLELARNKSNLVVSVIYRTAGFNTAGPRSLFGLSHGTSTGGSRALLSQREQVAGYMQATGRRLDTDTVQGLAASTTAVNGLNELVNLTAVYRWSTSDLLLFKNGTQIASSTTFQTDGTTSDTPSLAGVIGSNLAGAAEFFAGHIAEILVYNTADTAGTLVTQINDYAQATYGTGTVTPPVNSAVMPTTSKVGDSRWAYSYGQDFNTASPLGNALSEYGPNWKGHVNVENDTSDWGSYQPAKSLSVENSMLQIRTFYEPSSGQFVCACPFPQPPAGVHGGSQEYLGMRYSIRYRGDGSGSGYKTAWLLWSGADNWPWDYGEIDFPERSLNSSTVHGYSHRADVGRAGENALSAQVNAPLNEWHTATTEWVPKTANQTGSVTFFMDGVQIGTTTSNVPSHTMHLQLQTETWLDTATRPPESSAWNLYLDWIVIESYVGPM